MIGWVNQKTLLPELADTVFALEKGAVSDPVRELDYGWHLFLVEERMEARPLQEVRDEIEKELLEAPASPEEIAVLEEILRRRFPVQLFRESFD